MLGHLGAILGLARPILGHLGAILGASRAKLGPYWPNFGHNDPSWALLGPPRGHIRAVLGPSWGHLGPSWGHLGPSWGHLGPFQGYGRRGKTKHREEQQMICQFCDTYNAFSQLLLNMKPKKPRDGQHGRPQDGPRWPQDGPKMGPRGPRDGSKIGPKMA